MSELEVGRRDGVAVVTLNRPEAMNALSRSLRDTIHHVFRDLDGDNTIGAVVLTGAGDRAFCAGLDLKEIVSGKAERSPYNPVQAIEQCRWPVIGAINGVAVTGGLELALACDILICSDNARFADTHGRIGILPGWGLSQKLPRLIGISRAKEMSFTGRFVDAATAERWGIVNRVLPREQLLEAGIAMAREIAGAERRIIPQIKREIDEGFALPFGEALSFERERADQVNARQWAEVSEAKRLAVQDHGRTR